MSWTRHKRGDYTELGVFGCSPYDHRIDTGRKKICFERRYAVPQRGEAVVQKEFDFSRPDLLAVEYKIQSPVADCLFSTEMNFTLLAAESPDRYYRFPEREVGDSGMGSEGEIEDITRFMLVDEWRKMKVDFRLSPAATLWRYAIETVSQSEDGFEKTYQGSCLVLLWRVPFSKESADTARIEISFEALDDGFPQGAR
jgi:hypothetical protein